MENKLGTHDMHAGETSEKWIYGCTYVYIILSKLSYNQICSTMHKYLQNDYIVTSLLLSFDYHLRVHERFDASHPMTNNSTKLERSIESIIRIIYIRIVEWRDRIY